MKKHWLYLKYVLRHKYFVFVECCRVWRSNPLAFDLLWRGVIHDWSKFRPSEWSPYADHFYGGPYESMSERSPGWKYIIGDEYTTEWVETRFDRAWNHHQKRNRHHWQYWLLQKDDGEAKVVQMPEIDMIEMICDWRGAGRALGKPNTRAWYARNYEKIQLHPNTRARVDYHLGVFEPDIVSQKLAAG